MMLTGCLESSDPSMRPVLPEPPATFGVPVPAPVPVKGQDVRVLAAHAFAVIAAEGQRLKNDKAFQVDVWKRFSKPVVTK